MSEIKINTYTIRIRNKNSQKKDSSYLPFKNIPIDEYHYLDAQFLLKEFVKTFDLKFIAIKSESKAMKLEGGFSFNSSENSASGFFKAGQTGEQKNIYKKDEVDGKPIFTVKINNVIASEYFFKIWFPQNRATGLLLVQGTSNESAGELFKLLFHQFLNNILKDKFIQMSRFISADAVKKFINRSSIERIVLTRNRYPKDKANDLLGQDILLDDVRVKLVIEGSNIVKDNIVKFIQKDLNVSLGSEAKFFTSETLESMDFGESNEYDTSIYFKDKKNKKSATARSKSGFEIKPFTYIPENEIVRNSKTNIPTKESISTAVNKYFIEIKGEILGVIR